MKRKLLQRLVGPSTVLCIRFGDAENYAMRLFVLGLDRSGLRILRECADPDADALKKECSGRPVLISVSGYGVVTKPTEDTAIVGKVTSDPKRSHGTFRTKGRIQGVSASFAASKSNRSGNGSRRTAFLSWIFATGERRQIPSRRPYGRRNVFIAIR
ncbi:MAG: hypothetical protein V8Q44_09790 [Alistipes ihumii]